MRGAALRANFGGDGWCLCAEEWFGGLCVGYVSSWGGSCSIATKKEENRMSYTKEI